MAQDGIKVGEFLPFVGGVQAAVLSGNDVDRCVEILGTWPPFRDRSEAEQLTGRDLRDARLMAFEASDAMDLSWDVREIEESTDFVVMSKAGALALKSVTRHISNDVLKLLKDLNDGNAVLAIDAYTLHIGY